MYYYHHHCYFNTCEIDTHTPKIEYCILKNGMSLHILARTLKLLQFQIFLSHMKRKIALIMCQ